VTAIDQGDQGDQGEMKCPRCGRRQPIAAECVGCGVVFRKLAAPGVARRPRPAEAPTPGAPRRETSIGAFAGWLLVIAALGVAVWAWPGRAHMSPVSASGAPPPSPPSSASSDAAAAAAVPPGPRVPPALPESPAGTPAAPAVAAAPLPPSPPPEPSTAGGRAAVDESVPVHLPYSWYEDASGYQDAVAEARGTRKPMAVYFRTDWCPYCRRLDRDLLSSGPVIAYFRSVVKVRINPEAGVVEKEIARRYGVTGYPSLYLHQAAAPSFVKFSAYTPASDGWRLCSPEEFVDRVRRILRG
jgi:thiol-disulfide isomerase/thioredoxin